LTLALACAALVALVMMVADLDRENLAKRYRSTRFAMKLLMPIVGICLLVPWFIELPSRPAPASEWFFQLVGAQPLVLALFVASVYGCTLASLWSFILPFKAR
jgi:hypothetical protein